MTADEEILAAIRHRAVELADAAPPLNADQVLLLVSLFARYRVPAETATARRGGVAR